ncbi:A-agglutinin anchorage subunit-like isoform X2 [Glycine soja]|uniref:A-agglutinin anchorage subunit-like isoform X2 n=1 Tax=Glycine soja TaxID=3848 RepID=UPI00103C9F0B|nr:A-agglutinin anchorage subunit-like isoform X2 [Glycine soja]
MATTSLCHASAPTRASLHSTFAPICLSSSSLSLTSTVSSGASATSTMARHATTSSPSAGASLSIIRSSSPATLSFSSRTPTMEWSRPTQLGEIPSPRAGHAGVTVGENWFIVSGGDNKSGVSETIVLNMSTLTWSVVTSVQGRVPVASEKSKGDLVSVLKAKKEVLESSLSKEKPSSRFL